MEYVIRGKKYLNLTQSEYIRLHSLCERYPNSKKGTWSFKCHFCNEKWSSKSNLPYFVGGKNQCSMFCSEECALKDYDDAK
ncbi:hypothetical protein ACFVAD_19100 [Sutcliffiella sp. NPDC057660]|uniref:hypothetical protein n=1 Tax=Sutcliffiella sp. NPDC057660 TaxID=3346199 RepID=UPI0036C6685E